MNSLEKAAREHTMPQHPGLPDFEALFLLRQANKTPGLMKRTFIAQTMLDLRRMPDEERIFLHYVDALERIGCLQRFDQKIYITPVGEKRLQDLSDRYAWAVRTISLGV